jgi:hypothetical protein
MREKEQEKQWDELFDKIKPMTLPKQEWRQMEAPHLAILILPEQADMTKGKNVVIDDPRPENDVGLTPSHNVVMEKLPDGEDTITITIRDSTMDSHERKAKG